jgi:hypothetical protein
LCFDNFSGIRFSIGMPNSTTVNSGTSLSAAYILKIIIRYWFLTFNSLSHLRLNLFTRNVCAACLFTNRFPSPLQPPASVNIIAVSSFGISCMGCECMPSPIYQYVINRLLDFSIRKEKVFLWISR